MSYFEFTSPTGPVTITATQGSTLSLSASAINIVDTTVATDPIVYSWYSGPISGGTLLQTTTANPNNNISTYSLNGIGVGAANTYYCVATQPSATPPPAAVTSAVFTVVVNTALTISTAPVAVTVKKGATATFSVTAAGGTPPYTYAWELGTGSVGTNSSTLTIADVPSSDNGLPVTVTVTDSSTPVQSASSNNVFLTVTSSSLWIYIIIIVVVLIIAAIVIVVIILVIRNNNRKIKAEAAAVKPPPPPSLTPPKVAVSPVISKPQQLPYPARPNLPPPPNYPYT